MNPPPNSFPLFDADGTPAPRVPANIHDTGIDRDVLLSLLLKVCYTSSQTSTEAASARLLVELHVRVVQLQLPLLRLIT